MACTKCKICKSTQPCGCRDTPFTIPVNYITDPTLCPDPNPCSEMFDAQCICYTGDTLECEGQTWEIITGTNLEIVVQTLFNALCESYSYSLVSTTGNASPIIIGKSLWMIILDGANTATLDDGILGQKLTIIIESESAAPDTIIITPTTFAHPGFTTIELANPANSVNLIFTANGWTVIGGYSYVLA